MTITWEREYYYSKLRPLQYWTSTWSILGWTKWLWWGHFGETGELSFSFPLIFILPLLLNSSVNTDFAILQGLKGDRGIPGPRGEKVRNVPPSKSHSNLSLPAGKFMEPDTFSVSINLDNLFYVLGWTWWSRRSWRSRRRCKYFVANTWPNHYSPMVVMGVGMDCVVVMDHVVQIFFKVGCLIRREDECVFVWYKYGEKMVCLQERVNRLERNAACILAASQTENIWMGSG